MLDHVFRPFADDGPTTAHLFCAYLRDLGRVRCNQPASEHPSNEELRAVPIEVEATTTTDDVALKTLLDSVNALAKRHPNDSELLDLKKMADAVVVPEPKSTTDGSTVEDERQLLGLWMTRDLEIPQALRDAAKLGAQALIWFRNRER